ncbi:MAG: DUF6064 family protein [Pyrinomonadaceae bacterium]
MIPFTVDQFLNVFARYNEAVWPAQIVLYAIALCAIGLAIQRSSDFSRSIAFLLSVLWLWSGIVYHLIFFSRINPAAYLFGVLFIFQAFLFIYAGVLKRKISFSFPRRPYGIIGGLFLVYALVIYPILSYNLGHRYPMTPTFGVPCPTIIFTFGMFLWSRRTVPIYILVIPLLWSLVGLSAALSLGMKEDFGLVIAGLLGFLLILLRNRMKRPSTPVNLSHDAGCLPTPRVLHQSDKRPGDRIDRGQV